MKKTVLVSVGIPLITATLVNGAVPMPQEAVKIRCQGALKSDCEARVPRPLNGPDNPFRDNRTIFGTTTAVSSSYSASFLFSDDLPPR